MPEEERGALTKVLPLDNPPLGDLPSLLLEWTELATKRCSAPIDKVCLLNDE